MPKMTIKHEVEVSMKNKSGYKTTEFWLSLAAVVVSFLIASGAIAETSSIGKAVAVVAGVLGAMGYSHSRASVKKLNPPPED